MQALNKNDVDILYCKCYNKNVICVGNKTHAKLFYKNF